MPMKLCPRAIEIRDSYSSVTPGDDQDSSYKQTIAHTDRRVMARALARHMSRCKMCSK